MNNLSVQGSGRKPRRRAGCIEGGRGRARLIAVHAFGMAMAILFTHASPDQHSLFVHALPEHATRAGHHH